MSVPGVAVSGAEPWRPAKAGHLSAVAGRNPGGRLKPVTRRHTPSMDWNAKRAWAAAEHGARSAQPPVEGEREDFRLAAIAGASWAEGLAALMLGERTDGEGLLRRAADEYRVSWAAAPAASWGRPIAAMRCRLMAGDDAGLELDAAATLSEGSEAATGSIAGYATALALLSLRRDCEALPVARGLQGRDDFVPSVADALTALASGDGPRYAAASAAVIRSFEERVAFLEDTAVADTVLVLDALAAARGLSVLHAPSALLPAVRV